MMLEKGLKAPDFTLADQFGNQVSLSQFLGQKVVIYFYPRDDTPGCTRQACDFRDNHKEFEELGVKIIGISMDDVHSHIKFAEKYSLQFTLLSDPKKDVIGLYGTWVEKKNFGKIYFAIQRATFVVDENGIIEEIIRNTNSYTIARELLEYFKNNA